MSISAVIHESSSKPHYSVKGSGVSRVRFLKH